MRLANHSPTCSALAQELLALVVLAGQLMVKALAENRNELIVEQRAGLARVHRRDAAVLS